MEKIIENSLLCTGCRACEVSCGVHAISMETNEEGFLYPVIDQSICINCGKCVQTCPVMGNHQLQEPLEVYAAVHKTEEILMHSSSGGVFTAVAKSVLDEGGIVFGCVLDDGLRACHHSTAQYADLEAMRGSKYVQSDVGDTYVEAQQLLNQEKLVLYTGTPCQIAGLKAFLEKPYDNLLTIDLVCHGVPSPGLFEKHVQWLESRCKKKINSFRFRTKKNPTKSLLYYQYSYDEFQHTRCGAAKRDPYYAAFLGKLTYRESCYQCPFSCGERCGDITIADFWGISEFHPELAGIRGVSMVAINTLAGQNALMKFGKDLCLTGSSLAEAQKRNTNLREPSHRPSQRDVIYKDIDAQGYTKWANAYFKTKAYWEAYLKDICPQPLKVILNKFR